MSEMIERVAKAIMPDAFDISCGNDNCSECNNHKIEARERARAAIEAMREPTEEMLKEAGAETFCSDDYYDPHTTWQTMMNAALK